VRRGVDVLYQDARVVSLRYGDDSYTGGETPTDEVRLASFDAATGERLALSGLIVPGGEESLRALIENRFREVRGLPPGGALPLNGNFAVVEGGLLFRYNRYEIAGAAGTEPTQLLLTRAELAALAHAGSLLAAAPHLRAAFPAPEEAPLEATDPQGWDTTDVPR